MTEQTRAPKECIGFVGLGFMGRPLAESILRAGYPLAVLDIDSSKVEALAQQGAHPCADAADVARRSSISFCLVETTPQAREVILGPNGLAEGAAPGHTIVCMSTIDWAAIQEIGADLEKRGIHFVDAPVAGAREMSEQGRPTLLCFASGSEIDLARIRPVLDVMVAEVIHWGKLGSGTAFKLLNSMVLQVTRIVNMEAFALGAQAGLDPKLMFDILSRTYASNGAMKYDLPRVLARDFDGIRMAITQKDVDLQVALGKAMGVPMPMTKQAQSVYDIARAMGLADEDPSAVVKVYETWLGNLWGIQWRAVPDEHGFSVSWKRRNHCEIALGSILQDHVGRLFRNHHNACVQVA